MKLQVEESEFIPCDLQEIVRYLRRRNERAAARFMAAFKGTVDFLAEMPEMGRRRRDLGFEEVRSWRVQGFRKYLIFYEALPDRIRLLRVLHGYRDLPTELGQ